MVQVHRTVLSLFFELNGVKMENEPIASGFVPVATHNSLKSELQRRVQEIADCREILKSVEEENIKLKQTLKELVNGKAKKGKVGEIVSDMVSFIDTLKFQSPIVKKK
jgi:flagellar motility protein MotE (MotC chaperone)